MTKERPILFSGAMVSAILDGRKTQTRRVVKPQPPAGTQVVDTYHYPGDHDRFYASDGGSLLDGWTQHCPYGQAGDRLWVRETFFAFGRWETRFSAKKGRDEWHFVDLTLDMDRIYQYADPTPSNARHRSSVTPAWWRRPAIHMPRAASRIALNVAGVRVERLNDCSGVDAIAEGIAPELDGWTDYSNPSCQMCMTPVDSYRTLWDSINRAGAWDANPWVWVVEFRRIA